METKNEERKSYEVKYIDINDKNHEEKIVILYGINEEEIRKDFLSSNLKDEELYVINEPDIIITSINKIGDKTLI